VKNTSDEYTYIKYEFIQGLIRIIVAYDIVFLVFDRAVIGAVFRTGRG